MQKLLSYLALAGKLAVPVAAFFGVHIDTSVILLALASALKHATDEVYGALQNKAASLKSQAGGAGAAAVFAMVLLAPASLVLTGCANSAAPTPTATSTTASTTASNPPAAPTVSDLQKFAETVNNVVQTVNTGAEILSPAVAKAATLAQLVVHGTQETAILDKIVAVSTAVSSAGAAAGLPAPVVQAQVNATLTPAAAAAIVQQVVATTPTASN